MGASWKRSPSVVPQVRNHETFNFLLLFCFFETGSAGPVLAQDEGPTILCRPGIQLTSGS